jgi:hypothetical protein
MPLSMLAMARAIARATLRLGLMPRRRGPADEGTARIAADSRQICICAVTSLTRRGFLADALSAWMIMPTGERPLAVH